MANVFENVGAFTVQRLRGQDAAYLRGANRPGGITPDPVAVALGPQAVRGPAAGNVGAGEYWGVGVSVPAAADVAWVLVGAGYHMRYTSAAGANQKSYLLPYGDVSSVEDTRGPVFGYGTNLGVVVGGSGTTYVNLSLPDEPKGPSSGLGLWFPMDPELTSAGWTVVVLNQVNAAGLAQNLMEIDMSGVRLLGFPVNLWSTGPLWAPVALRGS